MQNTSNISDKNNIKYKFDLKGSRVSRYVDLGEKLKTKKYINKQLLRQMQISESLKIDSRIDSSQKTNKKLNKKVLKDVNFTEIN